MDLNFKIEMGNYRMHKLFFCYNFIYTILCKLID